MPSDREILFQGFSEGQKQAFLELAARERHAVQTTVLKEGTIGSEMLIVDGGILSVWVRGHQGERSGGG